MTIERVEGGEDQSHGIPYITFGFILIITAFGTINHNNLFAHVLGTSEMECVHVYMNTYCSVHETMLLPLFEFTHCNLALFVVSHSSQVIHRATLPRAILLRATLRRYVASIHIHTTSRRT